MQDLARPTIEREACPLCGGSAAKPVRKEQDATLARCIECSFLHVVPRPTEEQLKALYDDEYFAGEDLASCLDFRRPVFEQCLARLENLCPHRGRLLDVGCGTGEFVEDACSHGWDAVGIESSCLAAEFARDQKRLPVHHAVLQSAPFPAQSFSAVTLLDVLEHLRDPREELYWVRDLLRDGGIVVVRVPNTVFHLIRTRVCDMLRIADQGLQMRYHLNHFTPGTLARLLRTVGFEVLSIEVGAPETKAHAAWASPNAKRLYVKAATALHNVTGWNVGNIMVAYAKKPA